MNRIAFRALAAATWLTLAGLDPASATDRRREGKTVEDVPGAREANALPFGQGLSFATLDDYLAHLRRRGAYDVPWYREVSPGVYELVAGRTRGRPQRHTREELMRRFGFAR